MTDKDHHDSVEVKWMWVLGGIFTLFLAVFTYLDTKKLDVAVFREHEKSIIEIKDDLRIIRQELTGKIK